MAYPSDLVRTKNWVTETLTDEDMEGQYDLIINWIMAFANNSTGHDHSTTNKGKPIVTAGIADDQVTLAKIGSDLARADKGLSQHTDQSLQVDPSDTNPGLELADGGVRAKVDDTTIERAAGGVQVKDAGISQAKLKTTLGEVSTASSAHKTLPGGEYGFFPQVKGDIGATIGIQIAHNRENTGSYATVIYLGVESGTVYAQQRYVTASGIDHWLFLLIDKETKRIIGGYSALDHPAYGNGGDFDKMPHPFSDYDKTKHEIILIDQETIKELKTQATRERSLLTIVNEDYKVDAIDQIYEPLHSGRFLGEKPELIKDIPDYIKIRKLIKIGA